jgi:hypothetical protein
VPGPPNRDGAAAGRGGEGRGGERGANPKTGQMGSFDCAVATCMKIPLVARERGARIRGVYRTTSSPGWGSDDGGGSSGVPAQHTVEDMDRHCSLQSPDVRLYVSEAHRRSLVPSFCQPTRPFSAMHCRGTIALRWHRRITQHRRVPRPHDRRGRLPRQHRRRRHPGHRRRRR